MPEASEEVWRYSPIGDLDVASHRVATVPTAQEIPAILAGLDGVVVYESAGTLTLPVEVVDGVSISMLSSHPDGAALLGAVAKDDESLVALNTSAIADGLVIEVRRGAMVAAPIVIMHNVADGASFPRTIIRLAEGAAVTVVECFTGGADGALCVPVTEISVASGGNLRLGSIQLLDTSAWHLATIEATVDSDATIAEFTVGIGASYDRIRSDTVLAGQGASSILRSTYLGEGDQIHDLRTKQDHVAPKTISDLLCKGAVADRSRSIYSGLIKMRHGAVRSNAMQTNHNLVLSEAAHADSVPNLDISENDVRCSHASTVGPIDEDQRYYLESRGIDPTEAERLLVRGFFRDLLDQTQLAGVVGLVAEEIESRLSDLEIS
jgi:Fe-S cluster assembly protein SufD